jgi:hypothetical protein
LIRQVKVFAALIRLPSDVSEEWRVEEVAEEIERFLDLLKFLNGKRRCKVRVLEWWQAILPRRAIPEPQKEFWVTFLDSDLESRK